MAETRGYPSLAPSVRHGSLAPLSNDFGVRARVHSQLLKFCLVGAAGMILNLAVYSGTVGLLSIPPLAAAVGAFSAAVASNHFLNRIWTFGERRVAYLAQG